MLIPSCRKSVAPSKPAPSNSQRAPRPLRSHHWVSRALRTNQPCPFGTSPCSVKTSSDSSIISASEQFDLVADGNLAALDDACQHAAPALELGAQPLAQLVHAVARVADHRDLEDGSAGANSLADRPALDIVPFDGQVLPNRPRLDADRVEMLLRD